MQRPEFNTLIFIGFIWITPACTSGQIEITCDQGETQPCTCTDGRSGAQECNSSGDGWQACVCTGPLDGGGPDGTEDGGDVDGSQAGDLDAGSDPGPADDGGSPLDAGTDAGADPGSDTGTGGDDGGSNPTDESPPDPCAWVNCGHGTCVVNNGQPACDCDPDYHPEALTCVEDISDVCLNVDCGPHGHCVANGDQASCQCDAHYRPQGLYCVPEEQEDPCADKTCGDHGWCLYYSTTAYCMCADGYYNYYDNCVELTPEHPCAAVNCGEHGVCKYDAYGYSGCVCDAGYYPYGQACVPERRIGCRDELGYFVRRGTLRCDANNTFLEVCHDGDGDGLVEWIFGASCDQTPCSENCRQVNCKDKPCPVGLTCVQSAHEQEIWACVETCDCSNCGNCDPGDDWSSWQNYCGNPDGAPATVACKLPCPSPGDGCIPYNPPLCWPIEGCFSAPPVGP
jgi:hypothetical protein